MEIPEISQKYYLFPRISLKEDFYSPILAFLMNIYPSLASLKNRF